jgi:hypothetical protein
LEQRCDSLKRAKDCRKMQFVGLYHFYEVKALNENKHSYLF